MKKIVYIVPTFYPESFGGAEKQTLLLTQSLKNKYEQKILSPSVNPKTRCREKIGGIEVIRFRTKYLPYLGGRYFLSFLNWFLKLSFWLLINRKDYDIIYIVHGRLHSIPAVLVGKLLKKKIFVKIGNGGKKFDLNRVLIKKIMGKICLKILLKNVDFWIAISQMIIKDLTKYKIKKNKIYYIPNGVEIKKFNFKKKKKIDFIFFGRFASEKNLDFMIKTFAKMPDKYNFILYLIGDGPLKSKLKKLIKSLKLTHKIFLLSNVKNISHYIKNSKFNISCSQSEGMSNSLLESSALGVPSISSDVSGVNDIILHKKNGFIYKTNNQKELLNLLKYCILMNKKEYFNLSKNIYLRMKNYFCLKIISEKKQRIFN